MDTTDVTRRRFLTIAIAAAMAGLAGCGASSARLPSGSPPEQLAGHATRIGPGAPGVARSALAGFGSAFLTHMFNGGSLGNAAISPYSLFTVLAMARAGAGGSTAQQIDDVLGLDGADQGGAVAAIDAAVSAAVEQASLSPNGTVTVQAANETWVEKGFSVHQEYLDQLARDFGVAARSADFAADPEGTRIAINAWVSERTKGLIEDLFPERTIDSNTVLVLVNALYLKASWLYPFRPPQAGTFTTADGAAVSVPMLSGLPLPVSGVRGQGWTAAHLPYAGAGLAMTVLLPDGDLKPVLAELPEIIDAVATSDTAARNFELTLPVFSVRSNPQADSVVRDLGMVDLFGDADLGGIAEGPLAVTAFVHECVVKIDEKGTEAAAATGLAIASSGPPPSVPLIVDRPFAFWIADTTTSAPLFLGVVSDPRQIAD